MVSSLDVNDVTPRIASKASTSIIDLDSVEGVAEVGLIFWLNQTNF